MVERSSKSDNASEILDLDKVISKGKYSNNSLKLVLHELETKLSHIPEDKAVLILKKITQLVEKSPDPDVDISGSMANDFNKNIKSSVEAVIIKELEDWIKNRLPKLFLETVSAQITKAEENDFHEETDSQINKSR